jgi:hypothetical protein
MSLAGRWSIGCYTFAHMEGKLMHVEQGRRGFEGRDDDGATRIHDGNDFQRLDISMPDELHRSILTLVQSKYVLDKVVRSSGARYLCSELNGDDHYGPLEGPDFFRQVFPFVPTFGGMADSFAALVPTNQTVGCSWRWRGEDLSEDRRKEYFERFTNPPPKSLRTHTGYLWIRPLGLLLPVEGKNRVDFLREEKVEWFPAWATECDYPAPSRLVVYSVKVYGQSECWAVLDGRWVERMPHPNWSKPVLRAYGVAVEQRWPHDFPSVQNVVAGFERPDKHPKFMNDDVVDLDGIASDYATKNALVACSFMELHGVVRLRSLSIVWYWLGALTLSLLAATYLLRSWDWSMIFSMSAGAGMGACLLPFALFDRPFFRATRAMTIQNWQHD